MKRRYREVLPSYNDLIHDENPYKDNPPDFAELAKDYPEIRPYIIDCSDGKKTMRWNDHDATR